MGKFKFVKMSKSSDGVHKFVVELLNTETNRTKTVKFGAVGYKDYPTYYKENKEVANKHRTAYIARHSKNENFSQSGVDTAGWWAYHILWSKSSISASLADAKAKL
jgi:hypothetical protein